MLDNSFQLSDTGQLSSATKAFVERDEKIIQLLGEQHPFLSLENAIRGKKDFNTEKRQILVETLKHQYHKVFTGTASDQAVLDNIERLARPDTYTITTGQQLHLFLGPAFVIHKIMATIKAAEAYKQQYPELDFVPVYWLASEDHDFEEIKSTKIFQHQFDWQTEHGGATGRLDVQSVKNLIEDIRSKVTLNPDNLSMLSELEHIYSTSANLSEASLRVTHYFFGKYGLVCVDGDHAQFKQAFIPIIKQDIVKRDYIRLFNDFSARMENQDLSLQLKGRDINIFYLGAHSRSRITLQDGRYQIMDSELSFSEDEILADIDKNPGNYSPNAVLRPVYQETILPNICYIGGNAEVNYWLQLKDIFEASDTPEPLLTLRQSLWIVPLKISSWMDKQGIDPVMLMKSKQAKELINLLDSSSIDLTVKTQEFLSLRKELQDMYASEETSNLKELVDLGKAYEKLLKKLENEIAEKRIFKQEANFKKLENIKTLYFDMHNIQERKTSSLEMFIKYPSIDAIIYNSLAFKPSTGKIIST
jgi:bacillithiol biosynthesis cysteine-adding enzyme BshC